ncbi:hypothetical protein CS369_08285 [Candidatus Symbiopectobacterium sp. 'North America']|nr:hypothetical protein [Candidatus Symbiopectobacterium sp. 'North America']
MDSPEVLGYALCRHIPDMRKGFTIQTRHGDIYATADDAAPFANAMERVLMSKIRQIQSVDDTSSITLPELTHNQTASLINFLMKITSVGGKQVMGVSEAFHALREYGLKPRFRWPQRFIQQTECVASPEHDKQLYQGFHTTSK